jgi:ABC-type glycerol-3-phosphate transport system substrate-binding protein
MGDTKPFQIIVVSICIVLMIAGVLIFSFAGGKPGDNEFVGPQVVIWGTENEELINDLILRANSSGELAINARYVEKDAATFNQELLEALATGKGPDVILATAEDILTFQDKIVPIPFESLSERDFRDRFIEAGELFTTQLGYSAVPFSIDPLVLYWNRDIFTIHDKTAAPTKWGQVVSLVPELRDISEDLTVFEAAISLGDYRNITNAKAILSALILQSGSPITTLNYRESEDQLYLVSELGASAEDSAMVPAIAALNFYTQFADPLSKQYTWNRSLPNSIDMFASDDLAMYIGFGSETELIRSKNPNLNFDMALLPQSDASTLPLTYGNMKGFAILSNSTNAQGSYLAIEALTSRAFLKAYANLTGLPPVRRDLLDTPPGNAFSSVLYRSALYARGYLDPNPAKTSTIFQTMVEAVLSGRSTASEAVQNANNQLSLIIDEFNRKQENE